ncbi:MAG: tRNA lysidine(34) synthetase TilS, partial [Coriobacteriia bacterium]
ITGSGAGGLSSIPYLRGRIVRPLLDCDRADVRAYLRDNGHPWREDASNADTSRLRALVRERIVPVAEQVNPSFRETLARSIDLLAGDDALLSRLAQDFSHDFASVDVEGRVEFDRAFMTTLDPAMARRTVRRALVDAFPEASRLEADHVEALVKGLSEEAFARDLPFGLRAATEYGKLVVSRAGTEPPVLAPCLLPLPGNADLGPAGRIVAELVEPADIAGDADSVTIDAGDARSLVVDAVHPGDRMRPLGMSGSRKLSDLLTDAKVPRRMRATIPVIRDGERIVWLAGVRMSDEYRVRPDTRRAVRLTLQRGYGD